LFLLSSNVVWGEVRNGYHLTVEAVSASCFKYFSFSFYRHYYHRRLSCLLSLSPFSPEFLVRRFLPSKRDFGTLNVQELAHIEYLLTIGSPMRTFQKYYALKWISLSVLALILLQGCVTVGPEYSTPKLQMQDAWHQAITEDFSDGEASLQTWWTVFNDPILDSLIERASQGSLKLREAYAKITETRAIRGIKESERSPNLNVSGSATRSSIDTKHNSKTVDYLQTGADASWEIDFWGRISRSV
jgi:hypothetical protein